EIIYCICSESWLPICGHAGSKYRIHTAIVGEWGEVRGSCFRQDLEGSLTVSGKMIKYGQEAE
ncbi:MAG: hypothetical protein FWG74_05285, partial [Planctomycetes bacterium]|nr:hypothetical protein [Planctomycetota bacterium]